MPTCLLPHCFFVIWHIGDGVKNCTIAVPCNARTDYPGLTHHAMARMVFCFRERHYGVTSREIGAYPGVQQAAVANAARKGERYAAEYDLPGVNNVIFDTVPFFILAFGNLPIRIGGYLSAVNWGIANMRFFRP